MVSPLIASCCPHLHPPLQVSTPGSRGKTLITQIYFRDHIPGGYEGELETNLREVSQCLKSKNIFVDSCNNYTFFYVSKILVGPSPGTVNLCEGSLTSAVRSMWTRARRSSAACPRCRGSRRRGCRGTGGGAWSSMSGWTFDEDR